MKTFRWEGLYISSLSLMVVAAPIAGAGQVTTQSAHSYSNDEEADLKRVAEEAGIPLTEAEERFGWQNGFSLAATAIEAAYPDAFSKASIVETSPPLARIDFKGNVPPGIERLLASVDPRIRIELTGSAQRTSAEIDALVIRVHEAVMSQMLVANGTSLLNEESGLVDVVVSPDATVTKLSDGQIAQRIASALPEELRHQVRVLVDRNLRMGGHARFGGGYVFGSGTFCTGGFNVIRPTGTDGVATAGHCVNGLSHRNTPTAPIYSLTYHWEHRGEWGDFQWLSNASENHPNDFYYAPGQRRSVLSIANPSDDQLICRFGQTTGAQCSEVDNLSVCNSFDGINHCRLVQMRNEEADGGDSGGPWYWGNTAYGFHSGWKEVFFIDHDVWSRATYLDEALSVTVRTS